MSLRNLLKRIGKDRVEADELRFKVVSEAFGGIKEVKLGGLEQSALLRFDGAAKRFARTQLTAQVVGMIAAFCSGDYCLWRNLALVLFSDASS